MTSSTQFGTDTASAPHIINAAGLIAGSESAREKVAAEFLEACEHSGFFYLENTGIAENVTTEILSTTRRFFGQPLEIKQAIAIDQNNRGYLGFGDAKMYGADRPDLKEVFFFGREIEPNAPEFQAKLPLIGLNRWPGGPPEFRQTVLAYLTEIQRLGDALLSAIALALGRDADCFRKFYDRPMSRGQLIHYPPLPTDAPKEQYSVAAHTDFGCITLLLQELPGLEVQTRQGHWVAVPPRPNSLVVNIGDLLERWTGGRIPSTRHRVRNLNRDARYSVAIFHDPNSDAAVDPAEFCDNEGEHLFSDQSAAIRAGDYILGRSQGVFAQFNPGDEPDDEPRQRT